MNASFLFPPSQQSLRTAKGLLLAGLTGTLAFIATGCAGPTAGPTNPKDFIVQGRQWTQTDSATPASAPPSQNPPPAGASPSSSDPFPVPTPGS